MNDQDAKQKEVVRKNFAQAARRLLRGTKTGSLATIAKNSGHPYSSITTVASASDGSPIILISTLALHTQNILEDPKVSLMVYDAHEEDVATGHDPLTRMRATFIGEAIKDTSDAARYRYLARNPEAEMYVDFGDFAFYKINVSEVHVVAGFGAIHTYAADEVLLDPETAKMFEVNEKGAVDHMNEDHLDAISLYAEKLLGEEAGDWRIVSCDPDGFDVSNGTKVGRLSFPETVTAFQQLRFVFKKLSDDAAAA